ncbi:hypothetical protein HG530_003692 [Fusarium avenaceum]|nr:hypothetical protein HG530_003692 [Fusarium avenaceum]
MWHHPSASQPTKSFINIPYTMGDPSMVVLSRQEFADLLKNAFQSAFESMNEGLKSTDEDLKSIHEDLKSMNEDLKAMDEKLISIEGKLRSLTVSNPAPSRSRQPGSL